MNLAQSFKLKPEYFFSSGDQHLQLINVASDDGLIFRFTGPCRKVFAAISEGKTLADIKSSMLNEFPDQTPESVEAFLVEFVGELKELDVFDA